MHGIAESTEKTVLPEDPVRASIRNSVVTPSVATDSVSGAGSGPSQGCSPTTHSGLTYGCGLETRAPQ